MQLTKELKKYIKSLHQLKYRQKYNKFIAEGPKICLEFLDSGNYETEYIVCTETLYLENKPQLSRFSGKTIICNDNELNSISGFKSPNKILSVFEQISYNSEDVTVSNSWAIYCDRIQDPGNLGTIMRIADWFGIPWVITSEDSVEYYNPKVVQSAMGAHTRISFCNLDQAEFIKTFNDDAFVLVLNGLPLRKMNVPKGGVLVLGNESKGVCKEILEACKNHITIEKNGGAESLNASIACGIASFHIMNTMSN